MSTPILPRPDHIFEVAFTSLDDGLVWTNLTDYIELQEGIKVSKRRQNVFDDVSPATLGLALDNSLGTFNNDKAGQPFLGKVLIDVPSRLRIRWPNVPTTTANMLSDVQSLANDTGGFQPDQGSLGIDTTIAAVTLEEDAADYAPAWNTRIDVNDSNGQCFESNTTNALATFTFTGTKFTWTGEKFSDHGIAAVSVDGGTPTNVDLYNATRTYGNTLFQVSGLAPAQHTVTIKVTGTKNASSTGFWISVDTFIVESVATPPSGQTADLVWSTGVLDTTGVQVLTGVGQAPNRIPDDAEPIYVKPSTSYSARLQVKGDTAATGISFAVKARIRWYDMNGAYISDSDSAASTTLTTSYQAVSVTATSPANAVTARMGIVSQTLVAPAVRTITWNGGDQQTTNYGTSRSVIIPTNALVSDVCLAWVRVNNASATVTAHADWTAVNSWADSKGKTWLYRRTLLATDAGKKYTFSTGTTKAGIQVLLTNYSHVHPTTLIHQIAETTETVFRATHTTPNVTTTLASCLIVSAAFDVSGVTTSWGAPGGEQVRNVVYRTGGNSPTGIVTDFGTPQVAGTYGSKVFTANSSSKAATMHTLALAPATNTGPGNVTVQMGAFEFVQGSLGTWQQGGNWEALFTGLTDSWTTEYHGELTLSRYAATDRQKVLANIPVGSAVSETIMAQNPIAYYKLDEQANGTGQQQQAANSADVVQDALVPVQLGTGGAINWAQGTGPAVDGSSAVILAPVDRSNGIGLRSVLVNPLVNETSVTICLFWNSTDSAATVRSIASVQDSTFGINPRCLLQIAGTPNTNLYADASIGSEATSVYVKAQKNAGYFDGKTHCLAATYQLTGGQLVVTLYIDGVQQATASSATLLSAFPTMTMAAVGSQATQAYITGGTYSHAAFFDQVLDADTIGDINTAGTTGFAGDTIDNRMGRLTDWTGQDLEDLDETDTVAARHMPDETSLQEALRLAAKSEGGTFYIGGNGSIKFQSRDVKQITTTPLITVQGFEVDDGSFQKVTDDALLVNNPQIKLLSTGAVVQLTDFVSKALHGLHSKPIDTILASTADALNYATYVLAFYSEGNPRCDEVQLEGLLMQDWANVLLIDIWKMIRIQGLSTSEQVTTIDLFIEGFEINITPDSWGLTFDTSTAIPFCVLNDSTRGVCGASVVAW